MQSSHVFHRRLNRQLPQAEKAEGVWIYDRKGKKYLDASGGPICVNIGHGREEMARAIGDQAARLAYVHGPMFTNGPVEELAARLDRHTPESIGRFYFCSSGCEAIETAIKLARQVHLANDEPERYRVISRWLSYHGATLAALSVGGKTSMREPYTPMLAPSIHIPPPYCLRCHFKLSYPSCGLRCAHVLEDTILREGRRTISSFLAEPICGSTIGAVVPPREYYDIIGAICRQYGVLLILDEVMTGMGRTGKWFAAEHYDSQPDVMVLGKGLSSGYLPLSAVGCRAEYIDLLQREIGGFNHGHTFSHHAVAATAGLKVIDILEAEDLVDRAGRLGVDLERKLRELCAHPHVADIRGIGLMWAVELVENKAGLRPYPKEQRVAERLFNRLFDHGVITYPCSGFANGDGDAVMLGPPFVIATGELEWLVDQMQTAIDDVCPA